MRTILVTSATGEPVGLNEMRSHMRLSTGSTSTITADDNRIRGFVRTARRKVEAISGRLMFKQTWDMYLDSWPAESEIELPYKPLIHISTASGVAYKKSSGGGWNNVPATDSGSGWGIDNVSDLPRLVLKNDMSWPSETLYSINPLRIRAIYGYGTSGAAYSTNVPEDGKSAIKLLAAHYYENREASIVAASMSLIPEGIKDLIRLYKGGM